MKEEYNPYNSVLGDIKVPKCPDNIDEKGLNRALNRLFKHKVDG